MFGTDMPHLDMQCLENSRKDGHDWVCKEGWPRELRPSHGDYLTAYRRGADVSDAASCDRPDESPGWPCRCHSGRLCLQS